MINFRSFNKISKRSTLDFKTYRPKLFIMSMATKKKSGLPYMMALFVIWSLAPIFLKILSEEIDPWTTMGARYSLATLFWIPLFIIEFRKQDDPWITIKAAIVPGIVFTCGQICWSIAPYHNPAGLIMFIGRCSFIFSMFFGFLLLQSEAGLMKKKGFWLGALLTFIGLCVLLVTKDTTGASIKGITIMTATALFWGLQGVAVKYFLENISPMIGFAVMVFCTLPFMLGSMLILGEPASLLELSTKGWVVLLISGIVALGLGQCFAYIAVQREGPIIFEGCLQMIPFTAALAAWLILGEELNRYHWIAGTLLVAGSVMVFLANLKKEA